ncbi:glycerophosphoryl diester phosphodiesterase membrane domain-containing protein [Kitasatospora sp. NA04385]|uniref:glycerophosphoryl diester phosphodiesterase membrane domain-containing protein n=1 Tax=Kitasatospora sp. NA04385 TaxID=2742135 RepID=UPI00158FD94B|nr:glycerophosphoryl diester phosphodiesterase membrane domain-containing protein [Kitasatospora sp. NA04385]QKW19780.1 glycerophosphoryl diester phosphodiesterase membrane domain-containing protein [Kitasatospora sp. NA04385]
MTETPGWTSPGSPEPPSGTTGTGHPAPAAPVGAATLPPPAPTGPGIGLIPLRPLGTGELMDGAFALVRRNWRAAFGLSLAFGVVLQLLQSGIEWWAHTGGDGIDTAYLWPLTLLFGVLSSGLLAAVVSNGLLGRDTPLADAWARVRPRLGRLLLLGLLLAGIGVGSLALATVPLFLLSAAVDQPALLLLLLLTLPPVVWLSIRLTLAAPALVLEEQPVLGAIKRSWHLVRGSWWRIFGLLLLFRICLVVVGSVLTVPGELLAAILSGEPGGLPSGDGAAALSIAVIGVCGVIADTVTIPLGGVLTTLLYTDQRIRREALDLELARAAGLPGYGRPAPAAPAPAPAAPTIPPGA